MMRGAALGALLLVGCSDSNEPSNQNNADPCAGVVCERGSCDPASKQCTNPASCDADAQCLAGSICEAGACVDDPCMTEAGSPSCARGACERATGICQNAASCTPDTSGVRCLEGFVCFDRACKSEADICADLNCGARRGVCDPVAQACVAAVDCAGDDRKCLAGSYCAADDTCKPNACDITMKTCARGVCDAASAACVNASPCANNEQCVDGSLCLAGVCTLAAQACGAQGCRGNQICLNDAAAMTAACVEDDAAGCRDALDCLAGRVCTAGACAPAVACDADKFEPNNDVAGATDLDAEERLVSATLCEGDVDVFAVNAQLPMGQSSAQLVFDLAIPRVQVGQAVLKAELLNDAGAVVASAETRDAGKPTGSLRLSYEIGVVRQGVYQLRVSNVGTGSIAGVRYQLRADLVSQETLAACQGGQPIVPNQLTLGDLAAQPSRALISSCGGDTFGTRDEQVWTFSLADSKYVEIEARPTNQDLDLTLSLRSDCLRAVTEVGNGCVEAAAPGVAERFSGLLAPGDYTLIIEAKAGQSGPYSLIFTAQDSICTNESTCLNETRRRYCAPTGTGFLEESCADGCIAATGFCDAVPGDACTNPIVVDPATGYQGVIPIKNFAAKLDPGQGSCVPDSNPSSTLPDSTTNSNGSDVIFQVTLQPDEAVSANFLRGSQYISAYLLSSCDVTACLIGANQAYSSDESLFYVNQTMSPQTYLLVLDSDTGTTSTTSVTADIRIAPYVCTPGVKRCVRGRESQECNAAGSGYTLSSSCPFGCEAATGECSSFAYDTCDGASVLVPGVQRDENLSVFNADDAPTAPCATSAVGRDAVYKLEAVPPNSTVRVQMSSSFDAVLWAADSCDAMAKKVRGCFLRVDSALSNGTETLEFFSAAGGDIFIVADAYSSSANTGTFSILATILPPSCLPGQRFACVDATTAQYCNGLGERINLACQGGCADDAQGIGVCGTPDGDICADAIPLVGTSGTTASRNLQASIRTNALTLSDGRVGSCYLDGTLDDTTGRDTFYSVALQAGDLLTVTMTASNASAMLYLSENCATTTSCIGYYNARPSSATATNPNIQTIRYQAPVAQTIFVVADSQLSATSATAIDYTLSWDIQAGYACAPNATRCLDANTLEVCDLTGSLPSQVVCPAGCRADACLQVPGVDLCGTAPTLASGSYLVTDLIGLNSEVSLTSSDCIGATTSGPDAFYRVELQAGQLLRARLTSYGEETIGLALFSDCLDIAGTCVSGGRTLSTNSPVYSAEVSYLATQPETLMLMIDATSTGTSADEGIGLSIEIQAPNCVPGQATTCQDANTVQFCGSLGLLDSYSCGARTCTDGFCDAPTGDSCFDPFMLTGAGGTVSGTWSDKTAQVNPGEGRHGACLWDPLDDPLGREAVYAVHLNAGELLEAELTNVGGLSSTAWLYIVESCAVAAQTCASNHLLSTDGSRKVGYRAEQARTVFLIADTESTTTTDSFTMTWSVTPNKTCAPDRWSCVDANTVGRCDGVGLGYERTYTCANGCANGACVVNQRAIDTCGSNLQVQRSPGANGLSGGFHGFLNPNSQNNDLSFAANACGNSSTTPGRDQFIEVSLQPGEVLTANATATGKAITLQLVDNCADLACITGVQSLSTGIGAVTTLRYQAGGTAETIYLVLDSTSTGTDEPIELDIVLRAPTCAANQPPTCQGSTLLYCTGFDTLESYSCGARGCSNGACNSPTGDVCQEALVLQSRSGSVTNVYDGFGADLNPGEGRHGACFFDEIDDPLGRDLVYAIDLNAGDRLDAELTNAASAATNWIYVLENCLDEVGSCAANHYTSGDGNRKLSYVATQARRVFIVVDSESTSQTGVFTLAWSVTAGQTCVANQWTCVDGTTVGLCNATGSGFTRSLTCPGACAYDACVIDQDSSNLCGSAPAIVRNAMPVNSVSGGLVTWIDYVEGSNDADFSASSCLGAAPGRDTFYRVDLEPNEILDASVTSFASETVGLAIVQDCAVPELSCIVGDSDPSRASLTYQAGAAAETVFVVVDATLSSADEPARVELLVRAPDCAPGVTAQTCNAAGDGILFCNPRGFLNEYACDGTCSNAVCDTPRADLCLDPAWLNPGGMASGMYSVTGSMAALTNDYDLVPGNACLALSSPTNGRDAVYRVDLAAGQTMTAAVTSTAATPEDLTLYVLPATGCASSLSSCLAGADDLDASAMPETLTYTATAAETVYIVVDSYFAATSGAFNLNVNVQ
jgi:hypothetical protein